MDCAPAVGDAQGDGGTPPGMRTTQLQPQVFVVSDAEDGLRLDRFLGRRIPRMSRTSVQEAIACRVSISSGASPKPSRQVHPGEVVTIRPREASVAARAHAEPAVLHEADGWMIVDKPAGLATTPSAARPGDDLASLTGLSPAHRLDRFTSGCLLLTWTPEAARHFERVFRERLARKDYLAVVHGVPAASAFTIDAPIEPDGASRVPTKMRIALGGGDDEQEARTDVVVVAAAPDGSTSLLRAVPASGRRHQIRLHLAHAGHPLVGDVLYGGDERDFVRLQLGQPIAVPEGLQPGRHLLHAARLVVPDLSGEEISVSAPLPEDFDAWVPLGSFAAARP
jgi:RluA family pseudouridine synthase